MELEDLKDLLEMATPRPWSYETGFHPGIEAGCNSAAGDLSVVVVGLEHPLAEDTPDLCGFHGRTPEEGIANAKLTVALRNLAPELILLIQAAEHRLKGTLVSSLVPLEIAFNALKEKLAAQDMQ